MSTADTDSVKTRNLAWKQKACLQNGLPAILKTPKNVQNGKASREDAGLIMKTAVMHLKQLWNNYRKMPL